MIKPDRAVLFIAMRYMFAKHKLNFITIISYLSFTGITIGVAALIIVLSVFNGFATLVQSFLISFEPHIRVEAVSEEGLKSVVILDSLMKEIPGEIKYAPYVEGKVLAVNSTLNRVVTLKGIDESESSNLYGIEDAIRIGKYDLNQGEDGTIKMVLGLYLADRLQISNGDTINLVSPDGIEKAIAGMSLPVISRAVVMGIYISGNNDYDGDFAFTSLSSVSNFLGYRGNFRGYDIRLKDYNEAGKVKEFLSKRLNKEDYSVSTWYDIHSDLYSAMLIERWAAYILLNLIVIISAFNILASLSMSVIEKRRDIGVLTTMGMGREKIRLIFIVQGILTGLFGTIAGFALGIIVYVLQIYYKIYPLDGAKFKISYLPVELRFSDFIFVGAFCLLVCAIATILPAKKAASTNPLEAIRWE
ncbi:MAG: ABC transporter permease [Ignavibacteriaceae bacterium]|nr:ABC transporter permease [Ignavibacteriaceae bacterium]